MSEKDDRMKIYFDKGYEKGKEDTLFKVNEIIDEVINSDLNEKEKFKQLKLNFENMFEEDLPRWGTSEPTPYEKKHCFEKKYTYRGIKTDIFCDDYGQSYYFYLDGRCINCGSYDIFPEEVIKYEIDNKLDTIADLGKVDAKYAGAFIKYSDKKHIKAFLKYRGDLLSGVPINKPLEAQIEFCINILDKLFSTESFIETEQKRKESDNLYINKEEDK